MLCSGLGDGDDRRGGDVADELVDAGVAFCLVVDVAGVVYRVTFRRPGRVDVGPDSEVVGVIQRQQRRQVDDDIFRRSVSILLRRLAEIEAAFET